MRGAGESLIKEGWDIFSFHNFIKHGILLQPTKRILLQPGAGLLLRPASTGILLRPTGLYKNSFLILLRKEVLNRVLNLLFRMVTSPRDGRREMPIMSEKLPSSRLLLRFVNGEI